MPNPEDDNFEKYPFAYARYKIILDENGKPVDYRFLDVNPAFEDMTGLKKDNILNKTVTEVIPEIVEDDFDWISLYGHVALTGKDISFVQYFQKLGKWYQIHTSSSEKGYFVTLFSEISRKEAKFYEFAERSSDLIYRYEILPKPNITYINKVANQIVGYTPEEYYLDPQLCMEIPHPDDKQLFLDYFEGKIPIDKPIQIRWVHKNGSVVWIEQRDTPVYDSSGNFIALEGIGRDITDIKHAQEREEYIKDILFTIRNVNHIIVKEYDPARLIQKACRSLTETPGYYYAWIALVDDEKNVTATASSFPDFTSGFNNLDRQLREDIFPQCMQQVLEKDEILIIDDPAEKCSGCLLSYTSSNRAALCYQLKYNSKVYGILSVSIPLKYAYMEEIHKLFKEVSNDLCFALYKIEKERKIDYLTSMLISIHNVNQLIVTEKDPIRLIKGICEILTENQGYYSVWISFLDQYQNPTVVRQTGIESGFDLLISQLTKKGLPYCARMALRQDPIFVIDKPSEKCTDCLVANKCKQSIGFVSKLEYDNKIYGVISAALPSKYVYDEEVMSLFNEVVGDISFALYSLELEANRQVAEEALLESKIVAEEANRTKSEFLANMSHELRTPLNSVIGFSQVLIDENFGELNEKQGKYVSNVLKSGKHLLELINDILDLSKIEAGKMRYEPEYVNLSETVGEVVTLMLSMANKKDIELTSNIEPEDIEIFADKIKLKEIMYNLLNNAIKFTPQNGKVAIISQLVDDTIEISVSDNGIGIPKEEYNNVFDPFEQIDSSSTRKYGGTGLGLAIVKRYVKMHGGDIWVESEFRNGSTFIFTIPINGDDQDLSC